MGGSAGFTDQYSHPTMFDPFGSMPFRVAGAYQNQFARPLTLGYGANSPAQQSFISGGNSFVPGYMPTLTSLASNITQGANSTFGGYQSAVDSFMKQLPGFQDTVSKATAGAGTSMDAAKTALSDAMSPLQSRASFQEASRRALAPAREGAAARGMLEGGEAQAGEQSLLSDLAYKKLESDRADQQAAISGLSGAAGTYGGLGATGAQLAALGPEVKNALAAIYPQIAQTLTGAAQLPMGGLGQILQLLTGTQQPSMDLLKLIAPQMGMTSRTHSAQGSAQY